MFCFLAIMGLGYCPHCKKNVSLVRGHFQTWLFLLLFFTGIGWLIYLILWTIIEKEDKCVICQSTTIAAIPWDQDQSKQSDGNDRFRQHEIPLSSTVLNRNDKSSLNHIICPFCGASLPQYARFCEECGSALEMHLN